MECHPPSAALSTGKLARRRARHHRTGGLAARANVWSNGQDEPEDIKGSSSILTDKTQTRYDWPHATFPPSRRCGLDLSHPQSRQRPTDAVCERRGLSRILQDAQRGIRSALAAHEQPDLARPPAEAARGALAPAETSPRRQPNWT